MELPRSYRPQRTPIINVLQRKQKPTCSFCLRPREQSLGSHTFARPNHPKAFFSPNRHPRPRIRSSFLTTDAEDDTSFKGGVPFATMTLLSNKRFGSPLLAGEESSKMVLDSVFRTELSSRYNRDALCVNIVSPSLPRSIFRLLNVHLGPFDSQARRMDQMDVLARLLREPGCSGAIIAGDFNAVYPRDHQLIDDHELVDAWVALHGRDGGDTWGHWGVPVEIEDEFEPGRLDKVVMLGMKPEEIEVLQPGRVGALLYYAL
ncbi:uncharacterized protein LACBIDRAFT_329000 [Laccaria bicolor S238N-H82]|uniref:Predicted protein n=1 Tax=Laccaria bicolor (strain S238N-H82 / ATCC MYA-4686) TaxID=486041 RepID=B0DGQ7_LACBS|nr:uncharacterized protein LACBIDRAFT_329000 [Laccaria bicolor S238N-H82]EDR06194.1 predicted protein [Laccaria bicolor S238N-H82]|eukprot:XP_001883055.1 predicted protein [Laccaria bicolor S238N-H82]